MNFELDIEFREIVEAARDVIVVTKAFPLDEPGPEIVYVNPAFTQLTGYQPEEVIGRSPRILQSKETSSEVKHQIRHALKHHKSVRAAVKNVAKNGQSFWMEINIKPLKNTLGEVTHFVSIERDITEQKLLEEKLERLSKTDELTGLLNRRAFFDVLEQEFGRYQRYHNVYSILMFDLDFFKKVNDQYGHAAGDAVLQRVGGVCQSVFRAQDTVARIGGEEFCVILPGSDEEGVYRLAERLREKIANQTVQYGGKLISFTVSIGVSVVMLNDLKSAESVSRADMALYAAKEKGRNMTICYENVPTSE